jgi:hypothetical protein
MNFSASGLLAFTSANSAPEAKPPASGDHTGRAQTQGRNTGDQGFGQALAHASRTAGGSTGPREVAGSARPPDTQEAHPVGAKPKNPAFPALPAGKGTEDPSADIDPSRLILLIQQIMGGTEHPELSVLQGTGSAGARDFPALNGSASDFVELFRKLADEAGLTGSTPSHAGKSPNSLFHTGDGISTILSGFRQSLVGAPSEIPGQVAGDFTGDATGAVSTSHESLKSILKALIGLAEGRSDQGGVSKGAAQGPWSANQALDSTVSSEARVSVLAPGSEAAGKAALRGQAGVHLSGGLFPATGKAPAAEPSHAEEMASGKAVKGGGDAVSAELKDLLKSAMSPGAKKDEAGARETMVRGITERGGPRTGTGAQPGGGPVHPGQILQALADTPYKVSEAGPDARSTSDASGGKLSDMEAILKAAGADKAGAGPALSSEAGARPADAPLLAHAPAAQAEILTENVQASSKQGAASFEKGLQAAENRVVSQVFVRLYAGVRQGSGNMTINMHPPELGSVKVRISSERGQLNISLHPQNHQVVGILERHLPSLHQSLADQGIDIADMKVSVDDGGGDEGRRFADHEFQEGNGGFHGQRPLGPEEEPEPEIGGHAPNPEAGGLSLRI